MRLMYGAYEPDQPPSLSNGLQNASNVYPIPQGYRPVGAFVTFASALPNLPLGAGSFVSPQGTTSIIAGDASTLYRYKPTGWVSLNTGYELVDEDRWRFAQFGGVAIATNGADPMVKIDLASFTATPLGGSPPTTQTLAVVKDFLVGGVINGDVNTIQWSGINNAEFWTIGLQQCDYQILPTGGAVTGLLGGEFGIILQRSRVSRMTYVGNNLVFQFDEISNNIGCVTPHSVIQAGQYGFWLSDTGFMMWDGAMIRPIGQERVDRTFAALYQRKDWHLMSAAVDAKNTLVAWSMGDRLFVYNWVLDRWTIIVQAASIIFSGFSRDTTLEEIGTMYGSIDTVPYSLDDPRFKGGDPRFYVFDGSYVLGTFSGSNMAATFDTGDIETVPGREGRISLVRPIGDATSGITIQIASRSRLGDALSYNNYSNLTASGDIPVRERGRYSRFVHTIAAGTPWTYTKGLDVSLVAGGRR